MVVWLGVHAGKHQGKAVLNDSARLHSCADAQTALPLPLLPAYLMSVDSTAWPRYVCTAWQLGCCTTRPRPGYSIHLQQGGGEGEGTSRGVVGSNQQQRSSATAAAAALHSACHAAAASGEISREPQGDQQAALPLPPAPAPPAPVVPVEGGGAAAQAPRLLLARHHAAQGDEGGRQPGVRRWGCHADRLVMQYAGAN